ncbi:MAG: alpha/beta hydrolase fold domain-containing protein [Oscillospiraceae bacterium]|nr:alpha/beta hydrolase fold domain-containing protein [Oscillospiraceae bacterium]
MFIIIAVLSFGAGALICALVFSGKANRSRRHKIRRVLLAYLVGLVIFIMACFGQLLICKHPGNVALRALEGSTSVTVEKTKFGYFLDGPGEDSAFIFYPGGKVDVECYASLLKQIAENGVDVFMMDMPLNVPFLKVNAANKVIRKYDYDSWYIGGHSLGGVAASRYAAKKADKVDGLILIASYPTKQLPSDMRLLSVRGSLDGVLNEELYEENKFYWPQQSKEYVIRGGNHTNFADCSLIIGDNEATVPYTTQQRLCTEAITSFIGPVVPSEDPSDDIEQNTDPEPDPEPVPEPEPDPVVEEKPILLADRLNDGSDLWDGGRGYEFPEGETEVYTSKGRYSNIRVLSIASQEHSDTVVIYIHGGAYIGDFDNGYYYPVVKQITMDTGYEVLVPQYPLLTGFNFTHAYIPLQSLYYRVVAEYGSDHVIVMGDSAGGALAAGLCMQAAENNWEQPSQLVLVSPWVDLMITHPETDKYQELDKNLDAYMLRLYGEYWAAGENPSDYHLSPLYGDVTVFRDVTLYYGDSELFTPTEQLFYEKMSSKGVSCEQIIGVGMGHDCAITDKDMLHDLCDRMVAKQAALEEAA